eukprot:TRINITY_DN4269_c0_g3_i1.p1 TRINITY_DN4269_c0_g3~~TRINITY_DN4269_c0_g3_i1.p1  ORF type:complete len:795 (+),score=203.61 TRINITY_DN4269_c0_g3_i1:107-2491(+)
MAAVSDGSKKTSSADAVSKNQQGSLSLSAIPVSGSSEKKSKKEKREEIPPPQITVDAAPPSPRNSASSPTKSRPEKSGTTNSSKATKEKSDEKGSSSTREGSKSSSSKKLLKEELAAAQKEIARLAKENEELREQLETLQGVISVQAEQRAMTKKQQRRHKQKQQAAAAAATASTPRSADDSDDEEEFGDDQETEMFDKAASSDDTQVKRKLLEHKRTRSIDESSPGLNALVDSQLPPPQRRPSPKLSGSSTGNILSQSLPGGRDDSSSSSAPATPQAENGSAAAGANKQRPTRPTRPTNSNTPPRKTKFATATNLSKTFISQEDEKELVGSATGNDAARGRIMNNFALVSGEATPHSLKIGVLGTPDPNASPKPNSSNDDHPHIFDENTVLDILCGLGITSSRQFDDSADGSVLIPKDFSYSYQFKVRRMQDQLLKFKDFAPKVFHQIRKVFNVSESELLFSFRYDNLDAFKGAGKSGAFFIFTRDKRFILKTATKEERDFLWELLPYYLLYIRKNPNTMLPRFYGVYSMKHEGIGGVVRFVVMNNWFATHNDLKEKYDLKGSTVGRTVGVEPEKVKSGSILKDLDIKRKIYLPDNVFEPFLDQLKRDAQFLAEHNVMDYSLLVGMSKDGTEAESSSSSSKRKPNMVDSSFQNIFQQYMHGTSSLNADSGDPEIAYFGIIDVLQQYNTRKKLEHLLKSVRYEGDNISIVQPSYYAKRFVDFITSKFGRESEARAILEQRAAEERKEKRRSSKDKSKQRLKLSVPKEKDSKASAVSDDESSAEETRGKRSNTIY